MGFTAKGSIGREPTRNNAFRVAGRVIFYSLLIALLWALVFFQTLNEDDYASILLALWMVTTPALLILAVITPGLFYSAPMVECKRCGHSQTLDEFLNRMEKKMVGTTNSTKTVSSARPVVGATIGQGGPGLALGGYTSSSNVPVIIGRYQAIGICPNCENKGKCVFETEVQIWKDQEGEETTEIVGRIEIPEFGIN